MIDKKLLLSGLLLTLIMVGGFSPSVLATANVVEVSHSVAEKIEAGLPSGKIQTVVTLRNTGDTIASPFIYEAQPLGVASFSVISNQGVCLSNHPENQYRAISQLQPGETITFTIDSPKLVRAIYNVYGVTFSNCCFIEGSPVACSPVQPYGPSGSKLLGQVSNTGGSNPAQAVCGDNVCQATESVATCSQDCSGRCNDAVCDASRGENQVTCPQDCGFPANHCGNNLCEPQYAESASSCATDCHAPVTCGNNVCDADETHASCPADCKTDPLPPYLFYGAVFVVGAAAIWFVLKKVR